MATYYLDETILQSEYYRDRVYLSAHFGRTTARANENNRLRNQMNFKIFISFAVILFVSIALAADSKTEPNTFGELHSTFI